MSFQGTFCETILGEITTTKPITLCPRCNGNVQVDRTIAVTTTLSKNLEITLCNPNPCLHGGVCKISLKNTFYTCFCSSNYTGQ